MRWCFWTQMEDLGRMPARVLQVFDRMQVPVDSISSSRLDGRIFLTCVAEADDLQAARLEALLHKIEGMESVRRLAESAANPRQIALFRILCDITDRADVLHFITALNARTLAIRPRWVAFELVGAPHEIEGVYQSAQGYGIVDLVSSSCAFITSTNDPIPPSRPIPAARTLHQQPARL